MTSDPRLQTVARDDFIRRVLWTSVFFNLGGGLAFAFPSSPLGQLAGLPAAVPVVYRATVALFVFVFAGAYGWLARQPVIDQPMVWFAAIGKASFFALTLCLWLLADLPARTVLLAGGDLLLAGLFAQWAMASKRSA